MASTGLTVHKDMYNAAKRHVTNIVQHAKKNYFSVKIVQSSTPKQLVHITNQLAARKKTQALSTTFPLIEFPQLFADLFLNKIKKIRENRDNQTHTTSTKETPQAHPLPYSFSGLSCNARPGEKCHSEISTKAL